MILLLCVFGFHHSHFGEVDQVVLSVVRCSLLNEGQVSQVHSQVRDAGGVTAEDNRQFRGRHMLRATQREVTQKKDILLRARCKK